MAKDKNKKPSINNGTNTPQNHVGPQMVDRAPNILKNEGEKSPQNETQNEGSSTSNGAFTQTPPPNYQGQPNYQAPPGYGQAPQYGGQAAAGAMPYYAYNQKKSGGWWKGLLIFGIIVAVLVLFGYAINSFFSGMFSTMNYSYEENYELPDTDYIARIGVEGELTSSTDSGYLSSGSTYDHNFTLTAIDDLIADSNNKALLLFVDTPGGGVYESDELYLKIKEYQTETKRPVYVAMGSMAASGGYYISASADKILANRNCWTGSIGVTLGTHYDISQFLKKYGISAENLTSGPNKAMGSSSVPMTDEQRQIFQSLIDEAYEQFVGIIAEGREMSVPEVKKLADGRIYTALQAQNVGLIDGIATEDETTEMLKEDHNLQGCEVESIENYPETSWLDEFIYAGVNPLVNSLNALSKGELGTALDLAADNDKLPLKYIYLQ